MTWMSNRSSVPRSATMWEPMYPAPPVTMMGCFFMSVIPESGEQSHKPTDERDAPHPLERFPGKRMLVGVPGKGLGDAYLPFEVVDPLGHGFDKETRFRCEHRGFLVGVCHGSHDVAVGEPELQ